MLGDAGQHARTDLVTVVEGEDEVGPARPGEDAVGAGLPLDRPADAEQGGEDELGLVLSQSLSAYAETCRFVYDETCRSERVRSRT